MARVEDDIVKNQRLKSSIYRITLRFVRSAIIINTHDN